jgi:hypothetical protein
MRGNSGVFSELGFFDAADFTQLDTFTAEASLLAGPNRQAVVPRNYFDRAGAAILIEAAGILSVTGTPTFLFTNRLGSVIGASDLNGTAVGVSSAVAVGSGLSNQHWYMRLLLTCRTPGQGAGNTTLNCAGFIQSAGFALLGANPLSPGGGNSATWTATVNNAVELYPNLSATCSASSGSNTIRCKDYKVHFHS